MDEQYDVIVCGTGLKECIISGLLSVKGLKVLHVDRNNYYGGESASLNLTNLYQKFRPEHPETPPHLGANREWNVDLVPKFVMACGKLVKILLHTHVTRYLQWKSVAGTYVYQISKGGMFSAGGVPAIHKVPATDTEALKSSLMGVFEKRRCRNMFLFFQNYDINDPTTHNNMDLTRVTMREVFERYQVEPNTIDFVGHAMALYYDDDYLDKPALPAVERIKLYMYSLSRYGSSPFVYPIYGLGGIPEGFSRLCAIHGGTYMLNKPVDEILFDEAGKACGIRSEGEVARAPMVICDPSYAVNLNNKVRATGKVVRCICLLNHPIPNTNDSGSCQIILPQKQVGRRHDIYVSMVSHQHCIAAQPYHVAMVSTTVETSNPMEELRPAFELLGDIEETFYQVSETYEPVTDGTEDRLFISQSFDPTSHFESATEDCLEMYKRITGEELDMSISAEPDDLGDDQ